jgi:pimeloyl-ACP methyl ester carboxylesterase
MYAGRRRLVMATFVLIHGGGDVGWSWHLVEAELRRRGHDVVAPDLPCDDDAAGLDEYADTVVDAVGHRRDLVVVGHSYGGFTAPLVADRRPVDELVLVTAMVPRPGERPADWLAHTGWEEAVRAQARRDGGLTGHDDPFVAFYHDVPRALAEEAIGRERRQSATPGRSPWPLDAWPAVPTRFVACTHDRFFPLAFQRRVAADRLGIAPEEIAAGHFAPLSRPIELTDLLTGSATAATTPTAGGHDAAGAHARERG